MRKIQHVSAAVFAVATVTALSSAAVADTMDATHHVTATVRDDSATTAGLNRQSFRAAETGATPHISASRSESRHAAQRSRSAKSRMIARAKAIRKNRLAKAKRANQV